MFKILCIVVVLIEVSINAMAMCAVAQEPETGQDLGSLHHSKAFDFFGLVVFAKMGREADRWGDDTAERLSSETGGSWSSQRSTRTGFGFGVGGWRRLSPTIKLGGGFQYAQRGVVYELQDNSGGSAKEAVFDLNYIEMTLLAGIVPWSSSRASITIPFGLIGGYTSSSSLPTDFHNDPQNIWAEDAPYAEDWYIGGVVGIDGDYGIGPKTAIFLQLRYMTGFLDQILADYSMRSKDFEIACGLRLYVED